MGTTCDETTKYKLNRNFIDQNAIKFSIGEYTYNSMQINVMLISHGSFFKKEIYL